jgi:hypothetical protein
MTLYKIYVFVSMSLFVCLMVVNATFNNISVISSSWWSVLLVEETEDPEKTTDLSQVTNVAHLALIRTHNISGDRHLLHR